MDWGNAWPPHRTGGGVMEYDEALGPVTRTIILFCVSIVALSGALSACYWLLRPIYNDMGY